MKNLLKITSILWLFFLTGVQAQTPLYELTSGQPEASGNFGWGVAGVPDLDGDGAGDLLVGAYREEGGGGPENAGRAYAFSGASGALLFTLVSPNASNQGNFGFAVAGVADVNGDGAGDLIVGAPFERVGASAEAGRVYVFSGATGELLHTLVSPKVTSFGFLGYDVAGVPDADGDGRGDILVGAYNEESGSGFQSDGSAYLFSGATGAIIQILASPHPEKQGYFGRAVSGVPDTNGDGRGDLLVTAQNENAAGFIDSGRAYLFSGATSALLHEVISPAPADFKLFGREAAGFGDVDGDGRGDLAVTEAKAVHVYSGATGNLLRDLHSPNEPDATLQGLSGVPDVDGDGRDDILAGSPFEDDGRAYLFSGTTGVVLQTIDPVRSGSSFFAEFVAGVPDLNGDGRGDLLIGAYNDDVGTLTDAGYAYVYSGGIPSALNLAVEPLGAPIILPPEGGSFSFEVTVLNGTSATQTFQFWTRATRPDGAESKVLLGPISRTLAPGEVLTETFTQSIPGASGPGTYTYTAFIGDFPDNVIDSDSFTFFKDSAPRILKVTTTEDTEDGVCDANCSLGEAIAEANRGPNHDEIVFDSSLAGRTIKRSVAVGPWFTIKSDLTIRAPRAGIVLDAASHGWVFDVLGGPAMLQGLTITGGNFGDGGAGLYIFSPAPTTLQRCTITGNRALDAFGLGLGGGISAHSDLSIIQCTISDNAAEFGGSGVYATAGFLFIDRSTISGNVDNEGGSGAILLEAGVDTFKVFSSTITANEGGINFGFLSGSSVFLRNSIIAGNISGAGAADCSVLGSGTNSNGYNVVGLGTGCPSNGPGDVAVAPANVFTKVLEPNLADNGGPTETHALIFDATNPAIDIGGFCRRTDQRGFPAPVDGPDADSDPECDAGAVEMAASGN